MVNQAYVDAMKEVDQLVDGLGWPIDEKIKKPVAALRMHGFPTDASCEGHLDKDYPCYPWIQIYAPRQKKELWIKTHEYHRKKLDKLLDEFYKTPGNKNKFTYDFIGRFGGFRLVHKTENPDVMPSSRLLKECQKDFESLADFLIKKMS